MSTIEIKSNLHKLIDQINDESQLNKAYEILENISAVSEEGVLWSNLNKKDQEELLKIEKECHDPSNLIEHETVINKFKKWL